MTRHPLAALVPLTLLAAGLAAGLVGCGSDAPGERARDTTPTAEGTTPPAVPSATPDEPPTIGVVVGDEVVSAKQGSYCWSTATGAGSCVDSIGFPVSALPDVGSQRTLELRLPLAGAHIVADLAPVRDGADGPSYRGRVRSLGDGRWQLTTDAPAGRYRAYVVARVEAGEAPGEFVWSVVR